MPPAGEVRQGKREAFLLLDADIDRRQALLPQLTRDGFIALARKTPGAKLAVRRDRFEVEARHRRQNSCVTRITSSAVVIPVRTFIQPSSRRLRMPLRWAAAVI